MSQKISSQKLSYHRSWRFEIFLGIEFSRLKKGIFMSHSKYALNILQNSWLLSEHPNKFPIEQHLNLTPTDGALLNGPTKYRRLVGRLIYLIITKPDIVYSVWTLSQFMHEPQKPHSNATIWILKYIKGAGQGLLFPFTNNLALKAFCDSDWGGCCATRRSITRYCVFLGNSLISRKSKKHFYTIIGKLFPSNYHSNHFYTIIAIVIILLTYTYLNWIGV